MNIQCANHPVSVATASVAGPPTAESSAFCELPLGGGSDGTAAQRKNHFPHRLRLVEKQGVRQRLAVGGGGARYAVSPHNLRKSLATAAALLLLATAGPLAAQPIKVEIRGEPGAYQLYRGGKPYQVKGAGTQATEDFASVAAHGGNSIRTWSTGDGDLLDQAAAHGLTVALCMDIKRERQGFDYNDKEAVAAQFAKMRQKVLQYRDHPALLVWLVGNELNLEYKNPRVYDAVNDIAKMIHVLDPNHPVSTTTAGLGPSLAKVLRRRAPDLDFISVQYYGHLPSLPDALVKAKVKRPVMVTEWGTVGHWEVPKTRWGAPIELNSHKKAEFYLGSYRQVLTPMAGRLIGNYVFLWGHKQERTPTWYGVFTPRGERTSAVDVMHFLWTGKSPADQAPKLVSLTLEGKTAPDNIRLDPGQTVQAIVAATDDGQTPLTYRWQLMAESAATQVGGDAEALPQDHSAALGAPTTPKIAFTLPDTPGPYRLFVYALDSANGAAHANLPFYIKE